jgi:hypothetical protein
MQACMHLHACMHMGAMEACMQLGGDWRDLERLGDMSHMSQTWPAHDHTTFAPPTGVPPMQAAHCSPHTHRQGCAKLGGALPTWWGRSGARQFGLGDIPRGCLSKCPPNSPKLPQTHPTTPTYSLDMVCEVGVVLGSSLACLPAARPMPWQQGNW